MQSTARSPCCSTLLFSSPVISRLRESLLSPRRTLLVLAPFSTSPHQIHHLCSSDDLEEERQCKGQGQVGASAADAAAIVAEERQTTTIETVTISSPRLKSSKFRLDVNGKSRRFASLSRKVDDPSSVAKLPPCSPALTNFIRSYSLRVAKVKRTEFDDTSHRAVNTALWCNFLVFSLKFGVWFVTSSHVMLAEMIHSIADIANQALLSYGLNSSRRAPDALHPYGYSKERFVWSLISAVGIFCLGSGATIVHGFQNLWSSEPPENVHYAAFVIGGSFLIEGASLLVAINAVKKGAAAEGMTIRDYVWRGHDPTSVAVMTEDGAAVTGLIIAAASLVAVHTTGNAIYDPIGSIIVGNLLGMVAIFLIQRNRHALIGRAIDDHDMERVLDFLRSDPVVDSLYDCKSEVIGPGFFRFKAEIDFNGVVVVQNYLKRTGREAWAKRFREAAEHEGDTALLNVMASYGEELVEALGSEVDRLESEIQKIVPGIRHVDIEAHNPLGPA